MQSSSHQFKNRNKAKPRSFSVGKKRYHGHFKKSYSKSFDVNLKKIITSATIGNTLEWFEYTLYAYFAAVIGEVFFPSSSNHLSVLMTFCVFFVGFVARPFGGFVFGYIGDRAGRKAVLSASILLMAVPTGLIGILPSYNSIGILAPVSMIILRILQGLSLGGEFSTSIVYITESAPVKKRGFAGGFSIASVGIGFLLSILTVSLIESCFTKTQITNYAWRIPFVLCFSIGILGFYIRKHLPESSDFKDVIIKHKLQDHPLKIVFKKHFTKVVLAVFVFSCGAVSIYIFGLFAKTMLSSVLHFTPLQTNIIVISSMTAFIVSAFLAGHLADKINPLKLIICGALGIITLTPLVLFMLHQNQSYKVLPLYIALCSCIAFVQSPYAVFVVRLFPPQVRSSAVAVVYSFISVIFAGTAPIVAMQIIRVFGGVLPLCYYILPVCCLTIVSCVLFLKIKSLQKW